MRVYLDFLSDILEDGAFYVFAASTYTARVYRDFLYLDRTRLLTYTARVYRDFLNLDRTRLLTYTARIYRDFLNLDRTRLFMIVLSSIFTARTYTSRVYIAMFLHRFLLCQPRPHASIFIRARSEEKQSVLAFQYPASRQFCTVYRDLIGATLCAIQNTNLREYNRSSNNNLFMSAPSIQLESGGFFVFLETVEMFEVYRKVQVCLAIKFFALVDHRVEAMA